MQKLLRIERYSAVSTMRLVEAATLWWPHAVRLLRQLGAKVNAWAVRNGTRRALAELARHQLADIGKTFEEARRESAKPFWQA